MKQDGIMTRTKGKGKKKPPVLRRPIICICNDLSYPKPETQTPKPETRNPKPETRNPTPYNLNPNPQTLNPKT